MRYGDLWKWERKVMHEIIGPSNRNVFTPLQDVESRALLYQYLNEPDLWHQAHTRYSSSLIMSMVFGRRTKLGDPNVDRIIETNNEIMKMFEPGSSLIDSFPFLAYIPLPRAIQPWRWWGDSVFENSKKCEIAFCRQSGTRTNVETGTLLKNSRVSPSDSGRARMCLASFQSFSGSEETRRLITSRQCSSRDLSLRLDLIQRAWP